MELACSRTGPEQWNLSTCRCEMASAANPIAGSARPLGGEMDEGVRPLRP